MGKHKFASCCVCHLDSGIYIYFSTNVIMLLKFLFKEFYVVEKKKKIMLLDSERHVLGQGERFVHATVFAALS